MIKHNELVQEGNPFKPALDGAMALEQQMKQLIETSKQMAKALLDTTQKTDPKKQAAEVNKLSEEYKKQQAALKETQKIKDQLLREEAKYAAARKGETKELERAKIATRAKNKELQQEIRLEGVAKDSLERKRAVLAKMQQRYARLSGEMRSKAIPAIKKLDTEVKRLEADMGKHQRNVGNYKSAWGGLTKVLGAFGVMVGGAAIVGFFKNSITKFGEQEKAITKVRTALLATGQAAGLTLKQLTAEASRLQKNTIFGDETILNDATAQLLTFTNITGQNFLRTQQAALNLSTVLDGDLKSASIQLGKALNDPVANLSALSRSGIQFSKEQKAVINGLVAQNKLFEAQTIILDELDRQYGGQAEAMAGVGVGALVQFKNAWGDLMERVGGGLVRVLNPVIQTLHRWVIVNDDVIDQTRKEQIELNGLVNAIIKADKESKLRLDLVEKLKKEYPGYVSMLGEEGTTNENLITSLEKVNEQYKVKIGRMMLEAALEKEDSKVKQAGIDLLEKALEIGRLEAELEEYNNGLQRSTAKTTEELAQADIFYSQASKTVSNEIASKTEEQEKLNTELDQAQKEYDAANTALQGYLKTLGYGDIDFTSPPPQEQGGGGGDSVKVVAEQEKEKLKLLTDYQEQGFYITQSLQDMSLQELKDYFEQEKESIKSQNEWKREQEAMAAAVNKEFNDIIANDDEELADTKINLQKKILDNAKGAQAEHQKLLQEEIDKRMVVVEVLEQIAEIARFVTDSLSALSDIRVQKLENEGRREIELLEEKKEKGIINETQFAAEREKLEKQYNKKIAEEKKKQAKINKAAAITEVIINTAVAVSKSWAQTGVFGVFTQIAALVMGAAQIALIAAQPIPEFAKGGSGEMTADGVSVTSGEHKGKLLKGKRHSQGGTPVKIEAEKGEYMGILNRQATSKLKPHLPKIFESLNRGELPQSFGVNVMENLKVYERVNNQLDPFNEKIYNVLRKDKRQTYIQNGKMIIVNGNHKQIISV
jgi:hypothetical protein